MSCHSSVSSSPHSKPECLEQGFPFPHCSIFSLSLVSRCQGKPTRVTLVSFGLFPPLLSVKEQWEQKAVCTGVGENAGYQLFLRLFHFAFHKRNVISPSLFHSFQNNKQKRIGDTGLCLLMAWWNFSLELLPSSCVSKHQLSRTVYLGVLYSKLTSAVPPLLACQSCQSVTEEFLFCAHGNEAQRCLCHGTE